MTDTREAGVDPEADVVRSEMEVRALEGTRQRALIDRDMETLEQIFAEDLVHIHTNGLVHDRLALLSHNQFLDVQRPIIILTV